MSLVGDRERDRAASSLRRHYAQGRLTLEELSDRLHTALAARSHSELGAALDGLPRVWRDLGEPASAVSRAAARAATFVALAALWTLLTFVLLVSFAIVSIGDGPTTTQTVVFLGLWLALSYGTWRAWQRGARRRG